MSDVVWTHVPGYEDVAYEKSEEGIARIAINRPEVRNAFRPQTVTEMSRAFSDARDDAGVGVGARRALTTISRIPSSSRTAWRQAVRTSERL